MLTTVTLILCFFLVFVMLPIIIFQLWSGSPPSARGPVRKYELAQPWLGIVGNLFVLVLCFIALNRLIEHFGLVGPDLGGRIDSLLHYPFMLLFGIYALMWLLAFLKIRQTTRGQG